MHLACRVLVVGPRRLHACLAAHHSSAFHVGGHAVGLLDEVGLTPPPMIDPMMPSTVVQKIVIWTCITDFAITPRLVQSGYTRLSETYFTFSVCPRATPLRAAGDGGGNWRALLLSGNDLVACRGLCGQRSCGTTSLDSGEPLHSAQKRCAIPSEDSGTIGGRRDRTMRCYIRRYPPRVRYSVKWADSTAIVIWPG